MELAVSEVSFKDVYNQQIDLYLDEDHRNDDSLLTITIKGEEDKNRWFTGAYNYQYVERKYINTVTAFGIFSNKQITSTWWKSKESLWWF